MCKAHSHSFFVRKGCALSTCPNCGGVIARRLTVRYLGRLNRVIPRIEPNCALRGERCVQLMVEFRRTDNRTLTPAAARRLLDSVRRYFEAIKRRKKLSRSSFAVLQAVDVEERTLVVNAFYVGPELDQECIGLWQNVSGTAGEIAVRTAPGVHLAVQGLLGRRERTVAQAVEVEAALDGIRRVRAIGALYGEPDGEAQVTKPEGCPYDSSELLPILGLLPIERIEQQGYRELAVVRREVARSRARPPCLAA